MQHLFLAVFDPFHFSTHIRVCNAHLYGLGTIWASRFGYGQTQPQPRSKLRAEATKRQRTVASSPRPFFLPYPIYYNATIVHHSFILPAPLVARRIFCTLHACFYHSDSHFHGKCGCCKQLTTWIIITRAAPYTCKTFLPAENTSDERCFHSVGGYNRANCTTPHETTTCGYHLWRHDSTTWSLLTTKYCAC